MVLSGVLIGFRFHGEVGEVLGAYARAVAFGVAFSTVSAWIGVSAKGVEAAQVGGLIWMMPLVVVSSVFVPVATMPGWLEAFAAVNPITVATDAVRSLSLGSADTAAVWQPAAWAVGLLLVFAPLATLRFRRLTLAV